MSDRAVLHGYHFAVYSRIARIVLQENAVDYDLVEVDPFADDQLLCAYKGWVADVCVFPGLVKLVGLCITNARADVWRSGWARRAGWR